MVRSSGSLNFGYSNPRIHAASGMIIILNRNGPKLQLFNPDPANRTVLDLFTYPAGTACGSNHAVLLYFEVSERWRTAECSQCLSLLCV